MPPRCRSIAFFEKLGFFGIDASSARGAASFLRSAATSSSPHERMLWITPQGQVHRCARRGRSLSAAASRHLAGRVGPAVFLPLAIEYTFWEERLPEVLVAFGTPLFTQQHQNSCGVSDWNAALEIDDAGHAGRARRCGAATGRRRVGDAFPWRSRHDSCSTIFGGRRARRFGASGFNAGALDIVIALAWLALACAALPAAAVSCGTCASSEPPAGRDDSSHGFDSHSGARRRDEHRRRDRSSSGERRRGGARARRSTPAIAPTTIAAEIAAREPRLRVITRRAVAGWLGGKELRLLRSSRRRPRATGCCYSSMRMCGSHRTPRLRSPGDATRAAPHLISGVPRQEVRTFSEQLLDSADPFSCCSGFFRSAGCAARITRHTRPRAVS